MALRAGRCTVKIFHPFCISSSNGRVMWEEKGFGLGTVILVDDTLVVLSDEGDWL